MSAETEIYVIDEYTPRQTNEITSFASTWQDGPLVVLSEGNNLPEPQALLDRGKIHWVWNPRCLNVPYKCIKVWPASEHIDKESVKKLNLKSGFQKVASATWGFAKWAVTSLSIIAAIGTFLALSKMAGWNLPLQAWNSIPKADDVKVQVEEVAEKVTKKERFQKLTNTHPFYSTQDGKGLNKIFWNAGGNLLVMKKPLPATDYDSAEDKCEEFPNGAIPTYAQLKEAFTGADMLRPAKFEWTSDSGSMIHPTRNDDYRIFGGDSLANFANTGNPQGGYVIGDGELMVDEDSQAQYRCIIDLN